MTAIKHQIKLPPSVALEVVLQGLRIRLGRSIVTITGVVCGIAFLMSILTGQIIKRGVSEEDAVRGETARILNFIKADLPPLEGFPVALVPAGRLSEVETRVLEALLAAGTTEITSLSEPTLPRRIEGLRVCNEPDGFEQCPAFIVMGEGTVPVRDWMAMLGNRVLASTSPIGVALDLAKGQFVRLSRELSQEEQAKQVDETRKNRFRNIWIGTIALLVTVIGITNAMLMSVTERFREIGTMKCLGSLSAFIRQIFLIESSLMGLLGGIVGTSVGAIFSMAAYSLSYGFTTVLGTISLPQLFAFGGICIAAGVILSVMAALYPARVASRMVPAHALRSNV